MEQTIAAPATPAGVGGIAVVRISGSQAVQVAQQVFTPASASKSLATAAGYTAMFGHFVQDGAVRDEVVALVFRAPHSYTGEDVVELQCHGGSAVSEALLRAVLSAGARAATAGEFTKRAFLNGRISLTQAEAVMDIISAQGQDGARAAAAAMEGALYRKITEVRGRLLTVAGHIAAYTDYPEEDVPELSNEQLRATVQECEAQLQQLIRGYDAGAAVRRGVPTAIVGSPNVGKSTLLNLLAGFDRAIVTPVAGTTRDVVQQDVQLGSLRLLLADTAGLHDTQDLVEAEGIRRSRAELEKASLVLAVFDASCPRTPQDELLAQQCQGRHAVAIINKTDLPRAFALDAFAQYFGAVVEGSAKEDTFAAAVTSAVEKVMGVAQFDPDAALLANERQLTLAKTAEQALHQAMQAIDDGMTLDAVGVCVDDAHEALTQLAGEDATEDVINEVFSKFCVGK